MIDSVVVAVPARSEHLFNVLEAGSLRKIVKNKIHGF